MTNEVWQIIRLRSVLGNGRLYCGHRENMVVCMPSCPAQKCSREDIILFRDVSDARARGFSPCPFCDPLRAARIPAAPPLVQAAREYIEMHSAEKFSLDVMAKALFVNGSYLLRTFKASTGCTLLWYHNFIRCQHVKALLAEPSVSISEAGEQAGFASSSHFSHVFKKMTGFTPSQYREQSRNMPLCF